MRAYRITRRDYAATAFEGIGSKEAGGRWNSRGRPVVYLSEHRATAALEILVHARRAQLLRDQYVIIPVDIPNEFIQTLDEATLPEGWDAPIETTASTDLGDAWFDARAGVALRVPSVVVRGEYNVLLNPRHEDMKRVRIHKPDSFMFDPRLE